MTIEKRFNIGARWIEYEGSSIKNFYRISKIDGDKIILFTCWLDEEKFYLTEPVTVRCVDDLKDKLLWRYSGNINIVRDSSIGNLDFIDEFIQKKNDYDMKAMQDGMAPRIDGLL